MFSFQTHVSFSKKKKKKKLCLRQIFHKSNLRGCQVDSGGFLFGVHIVVACTIGQAVGCCESCDQCLSHKLWSPISQIHLLSQFGHSSEKKISQSFTAPPFSHFKLQSTFSLNYHNRIVRTNIEKKRKNGEACCVGHTLFLPFAINSTPKTNHNTHYNSNNH